MPLGKGYTVEEQLTGQTKVGGIRLDVFDRLNASVLFFDSDFQEIGGHDIYKSPEELGLRGVVHMQLMCVVLSSRSTPNPHGFQNAPATTTSLLRVFMNLAARRGRRFSTAPASA